MQEINVPFNGKTFLVKIGQGEKINIFDLWKAAGSPNGKRPSDWLKQKTTKEIVAATCKMHDIRPKDAVVPNRRAGIFCHHAIASRYAQHLDPTLVPIIEESWRQRIQEEQDPELGLQRQLLRSAKTWERRGESAPWIRTRIQGIMTRDEFTSMLAQHGVKGQGFKLCTDEITKGVVGAAAEERIECNLKRNHLGDSISPVEIAAIQLAEALATEEIEREVYYGNQKCKQASAKAARYVRASLT